MSDAIGPCQFHFRDGFCGFFGLATEAGRRILPAGLEPVEHCHGQSVLAVVAFDFHGGQVGPYRELVLAIQVAPRLFPGHPVPHLAMFPFLLGTTTEPARDHGIRQYHLPHYRRDIQVHIERSGEGIAASASDESPIVELRVTKGGGAPWRTVHRRYQLFVMDGASLCVSEVVMSGELIEHEEEGGALDLFPHDFTASLAGVEVTLRPIMEQWMRNGTEAFHPPRPT